MAIKFHPVRCGSAHDNGADMRCEIRPKLIPRATITATVTISGVVWLQVPVYQIVWGFMQFIIWAFVWRDIMRVHGEGYMYVGTSIVRASIVHVLLFYCSIVS